MANGKELATWKEQMAARVQEVQEEEQPALSVLSLSSGMMQIGDAVVPNNKMDVVILAMGTERTFYDRPYDPDDKSPPECYSQKIGNDDTFNPTMVPADNVPEPVSDSCMSCPKSKMGSADAGRGPACKTRRKLICAPASVVGNAEALGKQLLIVNVPPTSGKALTQYVQGLVGQGLPPEAAITTISYGPDKKTMFAMKFDGVSPIQDDATLGAIFNRIEEFKPMVIQPYNYEFEEEEEAPAPKKGRKKY